MLVSFPTSPNFTQLYPLELRRLRSRGGRPAAGRLCIFDALSPASDARNLQAVDQFGLVESVVPKRLRRERGRRDDDLSPKTQVVEAAEAQHDHEEDTASRMGRKAAAYRRRLDADCEVSREDEQEGRWMGRKAAAYRRRLDADCEVSREDEQVGRWMGRKAAAYRQHLDADCEVSREKRLQQY